MTDSRVMKIALAAVGIVFLTLWAYGFMLDHGFIHYDDDQYVYDNPIVREGLTWPGAAWAFTTGTLGNWHPLTWLSYMIDVELFGVNPGPMHAVNLAWHLLNSILLLVLLARLTGRIGPSAMVAALFALHPLHVESVAWISERKDVLSTFFGLLAIAAYAWYAAKPSVRRNALVAVLLALGLMAKPMLVTWPFVFLLLDYWPLRRPLIARRVIEKWPHFALITASAVVTYAAQHAGGSVTSLGATPVAMRLQNAAVAYAVYLYKTFWPFGLGVLYPFPEQPYPMLVVIMSVALLLGLTVAAILARRSHPYVLVGWLWYLGTLVPVIGLVRVGVQAYADRYTYIPLIGIFVALAWIVADLARGRGRMRWAAAVAGAATAGSLAVVTHAQAQLWRGSVPLFEHTLAIAPANPTIHYNLGNALLAANRESEAEQHFRVAASQREGNVDEVANLALSLLNQGRLDEAEQMLARVLEQSPDHVAARISMGAVAMNRERWEQALAHLERALELHPGHPQGSLNLGVTLAALGRRQEAIEALETAVAALPEDFRAQYEYGRALERAGRHEQAVEALSRAAALRPESASAQYQLGHAYLATARFAEAGGAFEQVIALEPGNAAAEINLGIVLATQQQFPAAAAHLRRALEIDPNEPDAHFNLALVLHLTGDSEQATKHVNEALRLNPGDTRAQELAAQMGTAARP